MKKAVVFMILVLAVMPGYAQTTLENFESGVSGWTAYNVRGNANIQATSYSGQNCMSVSVSSPGTDPSPSAVKAFPIAVSQSGNLYVDVAIATNSSGHMWNEVAYSVYTGDPGASSAGANFDGMPAYPAGTGHGTSWALIAKWDAWGLGTDTASGGWQTFSVSQSSTNDACNGGGSCPNQDGGSVDTSATENVLYIGVKCGGNSFQTIYVDDIAYDNNLPIMDWVLY